MDTLGLLRRLANSGAGLALRSTVLGRALATVARKTFDKDPRHGEPANVGDRMLAHKLWHLHHLPIRSDTVFYESFDGNGLLDNPRAVLDYLLDHAEYTDLRHVCVVRQGEDPGSLGARRDDSRVRFVDYRSHEYFRALTTAGYVINNSTLPPEFVKRPGQIYVNTWHGVPVKHMGYDMPDGAFESRNILRNFAAADYLISANPYTSETLYRNAYRLGGLYSGEVLEIGQPRVDVTLNTPRDVARRALASSGVTLDDRKVILYAPTWRGRSFSEPDFDAEELLRVHRTLQRAAGEREYQVLLKVHQYVARSAGTDDLLRHVIVPNHVQTNLALAACDILVTDYSSISFDFLSLDRPIVYYAYDLADYVASRGLYLDPAGWPGPVVTDLDLLDKAITDITHGHDGHARARGAWVDHYCPHDDGGAARRLVDVVFKGREPAAGRRITLADDRPKVLLHAGDLLPNGITSSLLALLKNLDLTALDVSLIHAAEIEHAPHSRLPEVPPGIRRFLRADTLIQRRSDRIDFASLESRGLDASPATVHRQAENFRREWRRCVGDLEFDHVIDFSGYSPFWSFLLLQSGNARRSIWVHNDLRREADNTEKRTHSTTLPAVFSMYRDYDDVVAVSPALRDITEAKLGRFARPGAIRSARNLLDLDRILRALGIVDAASVVEITDAHVPWEAVLERSRLPSRPDGREGPSTPATTFVTVGRLSPEKNHERLLRAFARVHSRFPDTRLVVYGEGVARPRLDALIRELGLTACVSMPGHINGVLSALRCGDCFVLSSDYEGQPVVLLEALALGLPVVTTRFDTVAGAVPADQALVVPATVDGLAAGLADFLSGRVPVPRFDPRAYNRGAFADFMAILDLAVDSDVSGQPPSVENSYRSNSNSPDKGE